MENRAVPIGESIRVGWSATKEHIAFFILLFVVYLAVSFGLSMVLGFFVDYTLVYIILNIAIYVVDVLLSFGLIAISLAVLDKKELSIGQLFSQTHILGKGILLYVAYYAIVLLGLILFIIPGIIFGIKYSQSFYLLLDKNLSVKESLKQSAAMVKGLKLELFLFAIALGFINLLGLIALLVGLFATVPLTMIASAYVYRVMLKSMPAANTETVTVQA